MKKDLPLKQYIDDDYRYRKFLKFLWIYRSKPSHLNHWLWSQYAFRFLNYSVTLLSQGRNPFSGVRSDLDLKICWMNLTSLTLVSSQRHCQTNNQPYTELDQGTFCHVNLETNTSKLGFLQCTVINSVSTCGVQCIVVNVQYEVYMFRFSGIFRCRCSA